MQSRGAERIATRVYVIMRVRGTASRYAQAACKTRRESVELFFFLHIIFLGSVYY